ncbi:MAG: hypothetical protein R6X02_27245 [Enhygromyxa sp.]
MLRARPLLSLVLLPALLLACDKGDDKQAKSDDKKAEDKPADKPVEQPAEKPKKLEHPWAIDAMPGSLRAGTKLTYKQTGKDAAGKEVEDDYACVVKSATKTEVGTVCNGVNHPSKDKGANEVATVEWSSYSPFFAVSQPKAELVERAELTVPAGSFDTVQAKVEDFFGNSYTFWMIADKPGIYAKVHKHANANTEDDRTDLVFELAAIE